jgi:hypothetical protein
MPHPVAEGPTEASRSRTYGARKENRRRRPGARIPLPVSVSYTEQVVGALDNESDSGMGLVFLLEPPFRVGQRIRMRYRGAPRSAVVKHITLSEGQFFVGIEWDDEPKAPTRRPSRDRR